MSIATSIVLTCILFTEPPQADCAETKAEMRGMTRGHGSGKAPLRIGREIPPCKTDMSIEAAIPAESRVILLCHCWPVLNPVNESFVAMFVKSMLRCRASGQYPTRWSIYHVHIVVIRNINSVLYTLYIIPPRFRSPSMYLDSSSNSIGRNFYTTIGED